MPRQVDLNRANATVSNDPTNTLSASNVPAIVKSGIGQIPALTPQYIEQAIANLIKEIESAIGAAFSDIISTGENAFVGLTEIIDGVGGTIGTDVANTILTIRNGLSGLLTALFNGLSSSSVGSALISDVEGAAHDLTVGVQALEQVAGKAWTGLQEAAGQITTAVEAGANTAWHDVESLGADVGAAVGGLIDALTNAFGGGGSSTGNKAIQAAQAGVRLALTAQSGEAAGIAAQNTLAQLNQGTSTTTGLIESLTFSGADGSALSSTDWSAASGLVVRLGSNNTPSMGISAASGAGLYSASSAYTYHTDNQTFECVLGSLGGNSTVDTYLLFHSNTGFTAGGYVAIVNNSLTLGAYTFSGGTYTFTPVGSPLTVQLSSGSRVEVHNNGNVYSFLVNGLDVDNITDSSAAIPTGSSYRSAQVLMQRKSVIVNPGPWQYSALADSFQLAGVLLSDYAPPAYAATGCRVARTTTSGVTTASGAAVPSTVFNAVAIDTNSGWSSGAYTIPTGGKWTFEVRLQNNGGLANPTGGGLSVASKYLLGISQNGTVETWGTPVFNAVGNVDASSVPSYLPFFGPVDALRDVFTLYCNAGDVIKPYVVNAYSSLSVIGDSAGAGTYFSAWLN